MKPKQLEIIVPAQNLQIFMSDYQFIRGYIDAEQDVPFELVDKFFDLMHNPQWLRSQELYKEAKECTQKALTIFKNYNGLSLSWKRKKMENGKYVKNDQEKVAFELLHGFLLFKNDHKNIGKDEAIFFSIMQLKTIIENRWPPKI